MKHTCKVIVMQVEFPESSQTRKLTSSQLGQLVGLKVKNSQLKNKQYLFNIKIYTVTSRVLDVICQNFSEWKG